MGKSVLDRYMRSQASLVEYINARAILPVEAEHALLQKCRVDELSKGHLLLEEGQVCHRLYFIEKGSARSFYDHDGKDVTSWIYREGQLITSWASFYGRTPSHESIELTEDAKVASIPFDDLHELYALHPKIHEFGRLMVEEQLVFIDQFFKGFMFMTAKEKYDLLLSVFPDVTQRVNLGHIASFLGITQETLSRIRKR